MLKKRKGLFLFMAGIFVLSAGVAMSSEEHMKKLPLYDTYRCAICHTSDEPTPGNSDLNTFGTDFHANGDKWDGVLAAKDSDGDGFFNGRELGDNNGDGIAEVSSERSNPGDPNGVPSSIDAKTWGVIKKLFED